MQQPLDLWNGKLPVKYPKLLMKLYRIYMTSMVLLTLSVIVLIMLSDSNPWFDLVLVVGAIFLAASSLTGFGFMIVSLIKAK